MIKSAFLTLLALLFLIGCRKTDSELPVPYDPYFGIEPAIEPLLLLPGFLTSPLNQYNGTFNAEGTEFYYTTEVPGKSIIAFTEMSQDGSWSTPKVASFSGMSTDYDPLFSPDGSRIYFSSQRLTDSLDQRNNTNIWYVNRTEEGWSDPEYIPLSEQGDYFSSLTNNGDIYFNTWSTGDIRKATITDTGYVYVDLPEEINGKSDVGDPFISPDEEYLIFRGYFEDSYGLGDLYISFRQNGQWSEPVNLGAPINSEAHEMCPYVTIDGNHFVFSSSRKDEEYNSEPLSDIEDIRRQHQSIYNGRQNIYMMSADFIDEMRPGN